VHQEKKVRLAHRVFKALKVNEDNLAHMVLQVNKDLEANKVLQELLVLEALRVHQVNKAELECQKKIKYCLRNCYRF
jgi:hypothetical protein